MRHKNKTLTVNTWIVVAAVSLIFMAIVFTCQLTPGHRNLDHDLTLRFSSYGK
ncbi:MAG: hypothetical protein AB1553_16125 [Nitrospirota bacterium]